MRVAIWHDLPPGGARRAFNELSSRLAVRHSLVAYQLNGGFAGSTASADPLPIRRVAFRSHRPVRGAFYWNDWLTYQDTRALTRKEKDLANDIAGQGFDLGLISTLRRGYAPALLQHLMIPTAYYCHEPPRRFYEPWCRPQAAPLTLYEQLRLLWRWPTRTFVDRYIQRLDRRCVTAAGCVLTNSRYTADYVMRVYGLAAKVSYLGVDATCFTPAKWSKGGGGLLSVGSFETHKGFDFLIQAVGAIPARRRPMLTLVGAGGHPRIPDFLMRLARTHSVQLAIYRDVTEAELLSHYQNANVFVFGARFEPFGLVVLEAMACGLPVVAVREGGVPEMVVHERTGYLVDRNRISFAAHIDQLISSPDLQKRFGDEARASVERFWTWDHAVSRLEGHLTTLLAGQPAAVSVGV